VAVASAGQYANHLHFAPDRQPHQHLITQFSMRRMLLLPSNQQCVIIEAIDVTKLHEYKTNEVAY